MFVSVQIVLAKTEISFLGDFRHLCDVWCDIRIHFVIQWEVCIKCNGHDQVQ